LARPTRMQLTLRLKNNLAVPVGSGNELLTRLPQKTSYLRHKRHQANEVGRQDSARGLQAREGGAQALRIQGIMQSQNR
jgi:hypothetical protein